MNGIRNGKGKEYINGKLSFEGEFLNGKPWNGTAKLYYEDDDGNLIVEEEEIINGEWTHLE